MSEAPDLTEDEALAAEHAIGLLNARERAAAETQMAAEPAFAQAVEAWRRRLAPWLGAIPGVSAPAGVWPRIERALPANDNRTRGGVGFWRGATVGSLGLAAASLVAAVMLANRPATVIQTPAPEPGRMLNASLMSQEGQPQPLFVAAYDPMRRALIITSLLPPGQDPLTVQELWLIPQDGKPRSLGLVEPGVSKSVAMPQTLEQMVAEGVSLAVSIEPLGGSPGDAPTGPITAVGKLAAI